MSENEGEEENKRLIYGNAYVFIQNTIVGNVKYNRKMTIFYFKFAQYSQ